LISLVLERAGATVRCAENGRVGVEAVEQSSFDLILMDMQMPVMDGYTATRELRWRGHTTPILALTAHAMTGDMQKCLDAGCTRYLSKPINPNRLLECVSEMLDQRSLAVARVGDSKEEGSLQALRSTLSIDDSDYRAIVEEFIDRFAEQLAALREAWADDNRAEMASIAHWLKGTGGTAGFDVLTKPAASLERLAKSDVHADQLARAIRDLEAIFDQIQLAANAHDAA
jgi:CheY-like chemotaxis protein